MAFHYEKLKVLRKAKHMSQMELAKTLGVGKSTIGMYESGQRTPEFKTLEAICDFFNISMTELSDNLSTNGRSNINITTNTGAVSGSGNATVVKESTANYGAVQGECMRLIEALFGDSPEALTYIKSLKISQSGKIEGLENIDVTSKALLDGARTTWIAALRNALEKGTDRVQIPV